MARRKRCSGPCGQLHPAERLSRVGGREALCPDCLLLAANELAPALLETDPDRATTDPDRAPAEPEPLPLRDEEERFEGMISYDVEGWPLRKGRLSASALGTFLRCPEQFRRQYVLGQRRPSGGTGLAGTGAHGAIEAALRFKATAGKDATPKQIEDTFDAVYDEAVMRARDREGIVWGSAEKKELDYDGARDIGKRAVLGYVESDGFRSLEVRNVEEVFAFTVPGVAVPFVGLIDVVTDRSVIDLKFAAQTATALKPDWRIQGLVYGFAKRRAADFHATSWAGKAQSPVTHPALRLEWDARQAILAADIMRNQVEAILTFAARWGPDHAWPGNLHHQWACARCEFRPECRWWNVPDTELLL